MHATVLVLGEDLEALMDPYSEHDPDVLDPVWDWWLVGGRWAGSLLATDASGLSVTNPPYGGTLQKVGPGQPCDQVRRGSLDIEGMRQRAIESAGEVWSQAAPVLAEHGHPQSRAQIRAQELDGRGSRDVWQVWRSQPGMDQLLQYVHFSEDPGEAFACSHEDFIERARLGALAEYAFLSGPTGWLRSRTYGEGWEPMAAPGYVERVNRAIEQASDDTLVSVVDYHC